MFSFLFVVAVGLPHDRLLIHTRFVLIWNFAGISFRRMWLLLPILSHPQILSGSKTRESQMREAGLCRISTVVASCSLLKI